MREKLRFLRNFLIIFLLLFLVWWQEVENCVFFLATSFLLRFAEAAGELVRNFRFFPWNTATYVALRNAACEISASHSLGLGFDFYSLRRKRLRSLLLLLSFFYCRKRLILEAFGRIVGFFLLLPKSCFCPSNFLRRESSGC